MPIEASEPTTIDKTYDLWAFEFQTIGTGAVAAGSPPGTLAPAVVAYVRLTKARVRDDGVWELSPLPSDTRVFSVPDLYALAATDADVAQALGALVLAVGKIAALQGQL